MSSSKGIGYSHLNEREATWESENVVSVSVGKIFKINFDICLNLFSDGLRFQLVQE